VVPDINMLGVGMKHEIFRKTNPTLVVAEDHGGIWHMPKSLTKELPQSNIFTGGHTSSDIFSLNDAQSNQLLLPAHLGYRSRTSTTLPAQSASE